MANCCHPTSALCDRVISCCAKIFSVSEKKFSKLIVNQDSASTFLFWGVLYENYPEHSKYNSLYFCPSCKRFDLEVKDGGSTYEHCEFFKMLKKNIVGGLVKK